MAASLKPLGVQLFIEIMTENTANMEGKTAILWLTDIPKWDQTEDFQGLYMGLGP